MASTRSSRSAAATLEIISHLSVRERLLVSQAVYEYGANAWPDVSKILSKHPLINRPKGFFSPQACQTIYVHLMGEAGYECSDETHAPHARLNLKLAQRHYQARVVELRSLILAEEERFRSLATEIDDIRAGRWDNKIAQELGISLGSAEPAAHVNPPAVESITSPQAAVVPESMQTGSTSSLTSHSVEQIQASNVTPVNEASKESEQEAGVNSAMDIDSVTSLPASPLLEPHRTTKSSSPERLSMQMDGGAIAEFPEAGSTAGDEILGEDAVMIPASASAVVQDESSPDFEAKPQDMSPVTPGDTHDRESDLKESPAQTPAPQVETRLRVSSRTQEEIKAIEALEELSRQKVEDRNTSIDINHKTGVPPRIDVLAHQPPPLEKTEGQKDNAELDADDYDVTNTPITQRSVVRGKRKAPEAEPLTPDSGRDKKKARDESVPTEDDDIGPARRRSRAYADSSSLKKFQTVISVLHSQISQLRNGNIFHNPVKDSDAPDYHEIVKRPMDLKTMKMKIKDGLIANSDDYQRDLYLMFANAMMYNRPKSDIYRLAQEMMVESEGHVRDFRQTEGFLSRGKR